MIPPSTNPIPAPSGAPAENVANAKLLSLPAGNAFARMPIAALMLAQLPIPCTPRKMFSWTPVCAKPQAMEKMRSHVVPMMNVILRP